MNEIPVVWYLARVGGDVLNQKYESYQAAVDKASGFSSASPGRAYYVLEAKVAVGIIIPAVTIKSLSTNNQIGD